MGSCEWVLLTLLSVMGLMRMDRREDAAQALIKGVRLTLILIGVLVIGIGVAFGFVFVGFHRIFFEGDSWIFSYADTFIRLYPERFWRDCFILLAIVTLLEGLLLRFLAKRLLQWNVELPA